MKSNFARHRVNRMIRHFIAQARLRRPVVPPGVSEYIVQSYVRLRKEHKEQEEEGKTHSYTSARTLLAVLRLSQALARLRFTETVDTADVDEALRLMEASKESLEERTDEAMDGDRTATSRIFRLMKGMATMPSRRRMGRGPGGERDMDMDEDEEGGEMMQVAMVDLRARVLAKGFTETQLMDTIQQVSNKARSNIKFTDIRGLVRIYQYYYTLCEWAICAVCGCRRGLSGRMYITEHLWICYWQFVSCAAGFLYRWHKPTATMRSAGFAALTIALGLVAAATPAKRAYSTHQYYVLHHDPSSEDVASIATTLGAEVVERVGELDDHWLLRVPKEKDRVMHKRTIPHGIRSLEPQVLRQRVKRTAPVIRANLTTFEQVSDALEIRDPSFNKQWHLLNTISRGNDLNVSGVWQMGITGKGTRAAIVDDGLDYESEDLAPNFVSDNGFIVGGC